MSFYADVDDKNSADRFDIDVADYFISPYQVITTTSITNIVGYTNTLSYQVTCNEEPVTNEYVYFESSDNSVCTIDRYNGTYILKSVGTCDIYCKLYNNPSIYSVVNISVVETQPTDIIDIITPNIDYIKLNETRTYTIYSYQNNEQLDTKFSIEAYDVPVNFFTMTTTDNSFTITYNRLYDDGVLQIQCTNLDTNKMTNFFIKLGGVW